MTHLRQWANRKIVDLQVWRATRRARRDRVLVVADHWDGSVQVFYHFLLGYFAPLARWLQQTGVSRVAVRDCGPMNVWFDSLPGNLDVQIVKPGVALHSIVGHRTRFQVVTGLDHPHRHKRKKLLAAIEATRSLVSIDPVDSIPILVVDRQTSDDFHSGPESETEMSGARRRSVPNLARICQEGLDPTSYRLVDMAQVTPGDQIAYASTSRILVAQHGAGLTHMVWMPPGSTIFEIHPPLPAEAVDVFRKLATALGHRYERVEQSGVHAPVNGPLLIAAIQRALYGKAPGVSPVDNL